MPGRAMNPTTITISRAGSKTRSPSGSIVLGAPETHTGIAQVIIPRTNPYSRAEGVDGLVTQVYRVFAFSVDDNAGALVDVKVGDILSYPGDPGHIHEVQEIRIIPEGTPWTIQANTWSNQ